MAKTKPKKRKTKPKEAAKPKFTVQQQKFIDAYDGDIKKAAEKAGLSYAYCRNKLVAKGCIMEAIKHRQDTEVRPKGIATRQERQMFWTESMRNDELSMKDRHRASELLGKSEADFVEVHLDVKSEKKSLEECQAMIDNYHKRVGEPKG